MADCTVLKSYPIPLPTVIVVACAITIVPVGNKPHTIVTASIDENNFLIEIFTLNPS